MTLDSSIRRTLRAKANSLKARINIGRAGVNATVIDQLRRAIDKNELVKVRVQIDDRAELETLAEQLAEQAGCEFVGKTGFVLTFYRRCNENAGEA